MKTTYPSFFLKCIQIAFVFFALISGSSSLSAQSAVAIERQIDSLMHLGIQAEAFPGAQVLVAHKNEVVFHKAYGYHTYDNIQPVGLTDVYDLASLTKILGPLPALMKLVDEGDLNLDIPFSTYWKPWRKRKDKKDLTLREILAHQAGLEPYIVFLNKATKRGQPKKRFIRSKQSLRFKQEAFENQFVKSRFENKVYRSINRSKVSKEKKYRYSGLSFLLFPKLIEELSGQSYVSYLQKEIYAPAGCVSLGFNPIKRKLNNEIIPTEVDTLWRKALVQGYVHDENAALLGGISGNAGLFGTADDVYKMLLLYQNFGRSGSTQILSKKVVKEFTKIQYPENDNRRGLGFDKPVLGNDTLSLEEAYPSPKASPRSFGHSGFTGTFAWADTENQLVFIFLSNRVYPDRNHRQLYELNLRAKLQDVFYSTLE